MTRAIEDLEVSVRTSVFLQSLGVTTLDELLAMPEIKAPHRMVAAELQELFAELEVEYAGKISGPVQKVAQKRVTGSVSERWAAISAWLEAEQPHALEQFNPPATAAAIAAAESSLGVTLPADYKEFLLIHNGQDEFAPWVGLGALLPIEEIAAVKSDIFGEETAVDADDVGIGVQPVDYHPRWIPISKSQRGRDFLCIDLAPAAGGLVGQIIEYVADDNARPLIAPSFAELMSMYLERAQTGEISFDNDGDLADE